MGKIGSQVKTSATDPTTRVFAILHFSGSKIDIPTILLKNLKKFLTTNQKNINDYHYHKQGDQLTIPLKLAIFFFFLCGILASESLVALAQGIIPSQTPSQEEPVQPETNPLQGTDEPPPLDMDRGIVRSLNIEESWVENAFYIHSINADNLSSGNTWSLSGELDFAFNSWIGGELDFPVLLMNYPIGSGPSDFGPIALGLRVVPYQTGSEVSREAAILSIEVEGNLWPTPQVRNFPGQGDSVTPEFLWAYRYHRVYFQGITGYTIPAGPGSIANPFFQTSAGRTWEQVWALQIEADWNGALPLSNGQVSQGVTIIPEVAYMPFGDRWLNEVGEGVSVYGSMGPQPTTYFMTEIEFNGL